ncbi:MAG: type II secretion system protein [Kiritimatiellae bacterium]|jgi:prepilin-type N-terminal cleavage/methylation domain-containing protein|nr:type II secretion system protein [Kiritimatiellia bacterium]
MKPQPYNRKAISPAQNALCVKPYSGFTIIELVIVIGILSILLAISLPTVKSVRNAAERRKAGIQATLLTQAVIKYKTVYGFWPGQLTESNNYTTKDPQLELRNDFELNNNEMIIPEIISHYGNDSFTVTTTSNGGNVKTIYIKDNYLYRALNTIDPNPNTKNGSLYQANPLNPKQIEFLDLDNKTVLESTDFTDPWDNQFIVFMGLNPKTTYTHEMTFEINGPISYMSVSNTTAFAFSIGPEANESRKYIYSAGVQYHER